MKGILISRRLYIRVVLQVTCVCSVLGHIYNYTCIYDYVHVRTVVYMCVHACTVPCDFPLKLYNYDAINTLIYVWISIQVIIMPVFVLEL